MCTDPARCRGFTLIELILAIVVLSAGLAGIMLVFTQTVARSADPMLQQQAMALAEGYLDEVLSKNNAPNCTAEAGSGSTRATWIAVGDYNGLDESPPRDIQGNPLAGLESYRVQVSTQADTLAGVEGCKITVTVTHQTDAGVHSVLVGWRMPDE
ncbi:MAG: type IV pilus modification PilV family protein [Pseudomonadota bacterium]|jgi:MSHA pilin protein MshD